MPTGLLKTVCYNLAHHTVQLRCNLTPTSIEPVSASSSLTSASSPLASVSHVLLGTSKLLESASKLLKSASNFLAGKRKVTSELYRSLLHF